MSVPYTQVVPKVEVIPDGVRVVLIATGDGQKERLKSITTNGKGFDAAWLKDEAIRFRDELNSNDDLEKRIKAVEGVPIDLSTSNPSADVTLILNFINAVQRFKAVTVSNSLGFASSDDVTAAFDIASTLYKSAQTSTLRAQLDTHTRF